MLGYAALADDAEAVRLLLQHPARTGLDVAIRKADLAEGEIPLTPLKGAMTFGSFDVAKQLLEAKADPMKRMAGNGLDAFIGAAIFEKSKNTHAWLPR